MKYRFNDHILFDADTRTLSPTDFSDDPISISSPSKRLLLLLIAHHGEAVGRELIFKKVWDDYGMVSSNNNLNQCVSKLRRVIKTLASRMRSLLRFLKWVLCCVMRLPSSLMRTRKIFTTRSLPRLCRDLRPQRRPIRRPTPSSAGPLLILVIPAVGG